MELANSADSAARNSVSIAHRSAARFIRLSPASSSSSNSDMPYSSLSLLSLTLLRRERATTIAAAPSERRCCTAAWSGAPVTNCVGPPFAVFSAVTSTLPAGDIMPDAGADDDGARAIGPTVAVGVPVATVAVGGATVALVLTRVAVVRVTVADMTVLLLLLRLCAAAAAAVAAVATRARVRRLRLMRRTDADLRATAAAVDATARATATGGTSGVCVHGVTRTAGTMLPAADAHCVRTDREPRDHLTPTGSARLRLRNRNH